MTEQARLAALWLPTGGLDENLRARVAETGIHPILGRGVGDEVGDCVLLPLPPGTADPHWGFDESHPWTLYRRRYATHPEKGSRFAPYLFAVRMFAVPEWREPVRAWLDQEHFDRQTTMDGVLFSEGYEPEEGDFHFLNLWALTGPDVVDSAEWVRVRQTPGWDEVLAGFRVSTVLREIYRVENFG